MSEDRCDFEWSTVKNNERNQRSKLQGVETYLFQRPNYVTNLIKKKTSLSRGFRFNREIDRGQRWLSRSGTEMSRKSG